jgi:hypothetical protein
VLGFPDAYNGGHTEEALSIHQALIEAAKGAPSSAPGVSARLAA